MKKFISILLCVITVVSLAAFTIISADCEETTPDTKISIDDIPREWKGEYDGWVPLEVVKRNLNLYITGIGDKGYIAGTALLYPSDKAPSDYGVNGKYSFNGNINLETGEITVQGYRWLEVGLGLSTRNFVFTKLEGILDVENRTINGTCDHGAWTMSAIDYEKFNTNKNFSLGIDNNSFRHNKLNEEFDGFYGINNYSIDKAYYDDLKNKAEPYEGWVLKGARNKKWTGACYGIACTMAMLFNNQINIEQLTDSGVSSYFDMPYPCDDKKLLNMIHYYHLSQNINKYAPSSNAISQTYSNGTFSNYYNLNCKYDSMSIYLQKLVEYTLNDNVVPMTYVYKKYDKEKGMIVTPGHAVLLTNCNYDISSKKYIIEVYDVNSVNTVNTNGIFGKLEINEDFTDFIYNMPDGSCLAANNYINMTLVDIDKISTLQYGADTNINSGYSISNEDSFLSNRTKVKIQLQDKLTLMNDKGQNFTFDGENFSGNLPVYSMETDYYDEYSFIIIETDNSTFFTVNDVGAGINIDLYNEIKYMTISVSNAEQAVFSLENNELTINGNDYDFEAYISVNQEVADNEKGLVSVTGDAKSDVTISANNSFVSIKSDDLIENVTTASLIGTEVYEVTQEEAASEFDFSAQYKGDGSISGLAFGDVSGDNAITASDALLILRIAVGESTDINSLQKKLADVNSDGKITASDALLTLRHAVGILTSSKVGELY